MAEKINKVEKFKEKLAALEEKTGYGFFVSPEVIENHIESNRLFAGWFKPGTVIATARNDKNTVIYEIAGDVSVSLLSSFGEVVHAFTGSFDQFENDEIKVADDKDIEALADGKHRSGYTLAFNSDNKVKVYFDGSDAEPVFAQDPSVARCILNGEILRLLEETSDAARTNTRTDALEEAAEELSSFEDIPDPADEPEENNAENPVSEDSPEYVETTEEGKKTLDNVKDEEAEDPEPVKEAAKSAKKTSAKKTTKKSKAKESPSPSEEKPVGRFDLLPLDIISEMINKEPAAADDKDVLAYIEEYKKSDDEEALISAAMYLAGYYPSVTDFVFDLALLVEKEAEEYGEDSWKEITLIRYINEAIKEWLMYLKEGNEDGKLLRSAWQLILAARVARTA